jgi:hypothetical protein
MKPDTCTVGCKLPNGLRITFDDGSSLTLVGANSGHAVRTMHVDGRNKYTESSPLPAQASIGVTRDVPRAAFEAWLLKGLGPAKSGSVFIIEGSVEEAIAANRGDHFRGMKPDSGNRVRVS